MRSPITIHIIEAADGTLTVCTSATRPTVGKQLSRGEALAVDLLRECAHRSDSVQYWQGEDAALAFMLDLFDPDGLGHADKQAIIEAARQTIHWKAAAGRTVQ